MHTVQDKTVLTMVRAMKRRSRQYDANKSLNALKKVR